MPRKNPLTPAQKAHIKQYHRDHNYYRKKTTPHLTDFERYWLMHDWGIKR